MSCLRVCVAVRELALSCLACHSIARTRQKSIAMKRVARPVRVRVVSYLPIVFPSFVFLFVFVAALLQNPNGLVHGNVDAVRFQLLARLTTSTSRLRSAPQERRQLSHTDDLVECSWKAHSTLVDRLAWAYSPGGRREGIEVCHEHVVE